MKHVLKLYNNRVNTTKAFSIDSLNSKGIVRRSALSIEHNGIKTIYRDSNELSYLKGTEFDTVIIEEPINMRAIEVVMPNIKGIDFNQLLDNANLQEHKIDVLEASLKNHERICCEKQRNINKLTDIVREFIDNVDYYELDGLAGSWLDIRDNANKLLKDIEQ